MSRALNDSELAALNVSGTVLRFAAENRQDLDTNIVARITAALDAKEANTWDQNTATTFWDAYRQLCVLIQPVTVDSLRATREPLAAPNWQVWRLGDSLARRSATRYITLLIVLLVLAVTIGFLASIQTKLVTEVEKLISSGDELTEKMVAEVDSLDTVIGARKFSEVTKPGQQGGISNDQIKMISALKSQLTQEDHLITQMLLRCGACRDSKLLPKSRGIDEDPLTEIDHHQHYYDDDTSDRPRPDGRVCLCGPPHFGSNQRQHFFNYVTRSPHCAHSAGRSGRRSDRIRRNNQSW